MTVREDTLAKLAGKFTQKEERTQARRFAVAGAGVVPAAAAISNLIESGRVIPKGVKAGRWLGGKVLGGAIVAGALPLIRRKITQGVEAGADERRRRQAISDGLKEYWATKGTTKSAEETRGKTKDAGIDSTFKATSRDNRTPFVGSTQFPTESSKGPAGKLLGQSQGRSEVGPMPSFNQLSKEKISPLKDKSVKQLSTRGMLPKIGADMSVVNDPLIQYFASQPGQEEFKKYAEQLKDNESAMPLASPKKERVSESTNPSDDLVRSSDEAADAKLKELFENYPVEKAVIS